MGRVHAQDHDDRYDNRRRDGWGGGGGGVPRQNDWPRRSAPPSPPPRRGGGDARDGEECVDREAAAPPEAIQPPEGLKVGDALTMYVAERTMLGYNVELVDHDDFQALLFHASIYGPPPFVGDTIQGFVCNIRDDGKVRQTPKERERGSYGRPPLEWPSWTCRAGNESGLAVLWDVLSYLPQGAALLTHSLFSHRACLDVQLSP